MTTQVLIIHGQLPFAIKLKQTLERGAPFEAHPFTSVEAAVDYLTDHIQDVAVVDFGISDMSGEAIIQQFRDIQPEIAVIVTPKMDAAQMRELGVIGSLDAGFSAGDLVNIVNNYFRQRERPSTDLPGTTALLSRISQTRRKSQPVENADSLADYSSLEEALGVAGTNIFDQPPAAEEDTPSNPSDELVWADESSKRESSFDDVLNALPPDAPESVAPSNPFNDLVNSMRTEEAHRPLPSRQQQLVEFILSGGTDILEDPSSRASVETPNLPKQAAPVETPRSPTQAEPPPEPELPAKSPLLSAFDRLSKEEPPPPTFEESGTVSDLVEGMQDRSFRNVLSILSGEEVGEESDNIAPPTSADFDVGPRRDAGPPSPVEIYAFDDVEPTPAKVILQRTLEQTMSGGTFSLEELLASIDAQLPLHRPKVHPLPSWLRNQDNTQDDPYMVREPAFLPEELPDEPTPVEASEDLFNDQTTIASRGQQIEQHPESLETEWLESSEPAAEEPFTFPDTLPEEFPSDATVPHQATVPLDATMVNQALAADEAARLEEEAHAGDEVMWDAVPIADDIAEWVDSFTDETPLPGTIAPQDTEGLWHDLPEQDFNTQFEMMAAFEVHGETGVASGALYAEMPVEPPAQPAEPAPPEPPAPVPEPASAEEAYLAQLALSLTEASLELTAEATLLARDKQIVAYAGRMPVEEIEELRETIADDWDAAPGEARIRFITAPGSGRDYMLFSRRTEDDFALSLIFAGTTPLRDIRRQGKRLVDALLSVPEPEVAPKPPPAPPMVESSEVATRTPYACVWLLRDPNAHLDPAVSQAVTAGLNVQMREQGWTIQTLQVHEDYVYLLADIPGETPAYQIVRDLKHRSAEIAHAQNPTYTDNGLWADSYLVVTPGRELDIEEIQQFINFERME